MITHIIKPAHLHCFRQQRRQFITLAFICYTCKYSKAQPKHVWNVILPQFVKKFGFECCFRFAQCCERHAKKFDNVKTWFFSSLNLPWSSFIDNVVYCKVLYSTKAVLLEVENTIFTVTTLVPMFATITPGAYTYNKQLKIIHAKCNLKLYPEKKAFDNQRWLYQFY